MKRFNIELSVLTALTISLGLVQLIPISGSSMLLSPAAAQIPSPSTEVAAPGEKQNEYYIFTQELNANETKLGVPVAVYTLTNLIVHKGDTVTIHFYNTADDADDRHTLHTRWIMILPVDRIKHLASRQIQ